MMIKKKKMAALALYLLCIIPVNFVFNLICQRLISSFVILVVFRSMDVGAVFFLAFAILRYFSKENWYDKTGGKWFDSGLFTSRGVLKLCVVGVATPTARGVAFAVIKNTIALWTGALGDATGMHTLSGLLDAVIVMGMEFVVWGLAFCLGWRWTTGRYATLRALFRGQWGKAGLTPAILFFIVKYLHTYYLLWGMHPDSVPGRIIGGLGFAADEVSYYIWLVFGCLIAALGGPKRTGAEVIYLNQD